MDRTKPQIDALKSEQFALPAHRKFPIEDDDDMRFAFEHAHEWPKPDEVRQGALKVAALNQLTIPDGWKNAKMSQTVKSGEISATATKRADGWYERKGKYFELDKTFTDMNGVDFMVPSSKAADVIPLFKPTAVNFKHDPTLEPLLNMLFKDRPMIESLEVAPNGKDVMATYALPEWFQQGTEGKSIPTSSEWEIDSYIPMGCGYVTNPAVSDSIMMSAPVIAAFKKFDTAERDKLAKQKKAMPDGRFPITDEEDVKNAVHDFGRSGSEPAVKAHIISRAKALGCMDALPADWGGKAKMAAMLDGDSDDLKDLCPEIQDHHDRLVRDGAECPGCSMFSAEEKTEWEAKHIVAMMKPSHLRVMQKMHDACPSGHCTHYATMRKGYLSRYAQPARTATGRKPMGLYEKMKSILTGAGIPDAEADIAAAKAIAAQNDVVETKTVDAVKFSETPEYVALMSEMRANSALIAAQKSEVDSAKQTIAAQDEAIKALKSKNDEDKVAAQFGSDRGKLEKLASDYKITPAERDSYALLAEKHPAAFADILPSLEAKAPRVEFSAPVAVKRVNGMPGSPAVEIQKLTQAYQAEKKCSYMEAFKAVNEANKDLARVAFLSENAVMGVTN